MRNYRKKEVFMKKILPILLSFLVVTFLLIGSRHSFSFAADNTQPSPEINLADFNSVVLMAIPPRTENLHAKPGETIQTTVRLRNVSQQAQHIVTESSDYVIGADGKTPVPITQQEAAPLRWSLASWMTVSPTQTTLAPNQIGQFDVVIQVPKNALPGGHYAVILHTIANGQNGGKNGQPIQTQGTSAVSPKVGTLVYVTVEGDIHEEAFIRSFTAPSWVEFGPVPMKYKVENVSDIHITPQASIVIKNLFGGVVDTIAVEQLNIFPYSTREFTTTLDKVWGFGPYRAFLTVPYGTSGKMVRASLMFWMIPYKLILAALVILAALLAIGIAVRRHIEHRNTLSTKRIEVLEERIKELETEKLSEK